MAEPDETKPTVSAPPDISSNPSESKKPKLPHIGNGDPPKNGDISPIMAAIPLPSDDVGVEGKEEWYNLRMTWSGKLYELKVGANDMFVEPNPTLRSFSS